MSRVTVTEDEFGGLRVTVGPRRRLSIALFLTIWCCGWALGEILVPYSFVTGGMKGASAPASLFLSVWLCFWTYAGISALYIWGMNLFGREVVVLGGSQLELRTEVGPIVRSRSLDLDGARNLRYSPPGTNTRPATSFTDTMGMSGSLAFDHGGKTYRFGAGLSETDSKRLILTIQKYFPIEEEPLQPFPITR